MTERWVAGHVPGLPPEALRYETLSFGGAASSIGDDRSLSIDVPALDAAQMSAVAAHVRASARVTLRSMPVSQIIERIDRAVLRLLDPADTHRRDLDRLLPAVTGYDAEMIRLGLNGYLQAFRATELHRFVAEDFANPKVLDEFQPVVKGGRVRALGPDLLVHGWAGNVPGLPLWSFASGLLVKAGNIGKLPSAEPVFATVFARALIDVDSSLADCFAILWWKGGEACVAQPLFDAADVVIAYGGDSSIADVRALVPATTRFLAYGNKIGVALVGREALDAQKGVATARRAARDVVRYDQQGCYSPQVIYVERGASIDPRAFAQYVAAELGNLAHRFPRRALALEDAVAVGEWRHGHEIAVLDDPSSALIGDTDAQWAVAYSDRSRALSPTATQRTVTVIAVDALEDAIDGIAPMARVLQTAGVAVAPARLRALSDRLADAGITRIAALGQMTLPEAGWHHDGRCNLADLVRIVEVERSAERYADMLADYALEHPA